MNRRLEKEEDSMKKLAKKVQQFLVSEDGPTAVEYAVMLALIIVSVIGAIWEVSSQTGGMYSDINSSLEATNFGNN